MHAICCFALFISLFLRGEKTQLLNPSKGKISNNRWKYSAYQELYTGLYGKLKKYFKNYMQKRLNFNKIWHIPVRTQGKRKPVDFFGINFVSFSGVKQLIVCKSIIKKDHCKSSKNITPEDFLVWNRISFNITSNFRHWKLNMNVGSLMLLVYQKQVSDTAYGHITLGKAKWNCSIAAEIFGQNLIFFQIP